MTMLRATAPAVALLGLLAGCASGDKSRPQPRLGRTVVAVYTDIDGVSLSIDGANYARFTDFLEREENVALTPAQLANVVDALEREGFFQEGSRPLPRRGPTVPPAIFRICVTSPHRSKEVVFLCEKGNNVPARYREIFATLPIAARPAALARFLQLNQQAD